MNQRTRMFNTLALLAAAMTATAALLAWITPSISRSDQAESVAHRAHAAVVDGLLIRSDHWQSIEILAGIPTDDRSFLAGRPRRTDVHFHVDSAGQPRRAGRWRDQQPASDRPGSICIEVEPLGAGASMSSSQWSCVRALIASLNSSLRPNGGSLPVRMAAVWSGVYGLDPDAVFEIAPPLSIPN